MSIAMSNIHPPTPQTPTTSRLYTPEPAPMRDTPEGKGRLYNTFLFQTYDFLCNPRYSETVCWGERGDSFLVKNPAALARDILPVYFKHKNITSFVRQLNIYGFHKQSSADPGVWIFSHPKFKRGDREALIDIKRKVSSETVSRTKVAELSSEKNQLSTSVKSLEEKIQDLQETVRDLRQKLADSRHSEETLQKDLSTLAKYVCTITPGLLPESKKRRLASQPLDVSETGAIMQKYLGAESSPEATPSPGHGSATGPADERSFFSLLEGTPGPSQPWAGSNSLSLCESPPLFSLPLGTYTADSSPGAHLGHRTISPFLGHGTHGAAFGDDPLRFDQPWWDAMQSDSRPSNPAHRHAPSGGGTRSPGQDSIAKSLAGLGLDRLYTPDDALSTDALKEEPISAPISDPASDFDLDLDLNFRFSTATATDAATATATARPASSTLCSPGAGSEPGMQQVHALAEKLIEALARVCQLQAVTATATSSAIVHNFVSHMRSQPAPPRAPDCKPWSSVAFPVDV